MRRPRRALADVGVAEFSNFFSDSALAVAPVRPRGWLSGAGPRISARRLAETLRLLSTRAGLSSAARCSSSGWTSGRDAFECGARAGFRGAGMGCNMGRVRDGEGRAELLRPLRRRDELRASAPRCRTHGRENTLRLCAGSRGRREPDAGLPRSRPSESALPPAPTAWRFERGRRVTGLSFSLGHMWRHIGGPCPSLVPRSFLRRDHSLIYSNRF